MRAVSIVFGAFSCWLFGAQVLAQQGDRQLVVVRSQPSVLQLVAAFDAQLVRPANLDFARDRSGRSIVEARSAAERPAAVSVSDFQWRCIAEDPASCLQWSGGPVAVAVQDEPMSLGTGFVVDAAGTLLTNQHVISPELQAASPVALRAFANADLRQAMLGIRRLVGAAAPRDLLGALEGSLVPWLLSHYEVRGVSLREVRVTTHLRPRALGIRLRLQAEPTPPAEQDWKESTVPCQVLVTGEVYPGRDVAVLRAADLADKLISLPLGDSRRTFPGTRIVALGFPGAAAETYGVDADAARFRVIAHEGIVDQRLPVKGGWEAFHMTADTNHGDSGGPVLDESGHVIAMTVAGNPNAPAQNLSIPIEIAKQQLQRAGVEPGRNKVTETWNRACDELQANRVAPALALFEEVNRLQGGWVLGGAGGGQASEMIVMCRRELGLPEGGAPNGGLRPRGLVPAGTPNPVRPPGESQPHPGLATTPKIVPQVGVPRPLQLAAKPAPESWWDTAWQFYGALPLTMQILIPLLLVAGAAGVLRRMFR